MCQKNLSLVKSAKNETTNNETCTNDDEINEDYATVNSANETSDEGGEEQNKTDVKKVKVFTIC